MAEYDETGETICTCPACGKRVTSLDDCGKHVDDRCKSYLWEDRRSRSKTPAASQKSKKPKTPSKTNSKTPKKTPKKTPLTETSGNGNINSFFSKSAPAMKRSASTPTPSASQSKRRKETPVPPPSSAPPSSQNSEAMERAIRESREMALLEQFQREQDAEDERERREAEAEEAARERWRTHGRKELDDRLLLHTRIIAHQAAAIERDEPLAHDNVAETSKAEAEAAGSKAAAKAEAKAAKAEAKAKAKAEKARLKAEAVTETPESAASGTSGRETALRPETPVPPPSSQSRKSKGKGKGSSDPSPSQGGSGSESPAQSSSSNSSPSGCSSNGRKETPVPPPPSKFSPSSSQNKRSRSKSVPPSSNPTPSASQNNKEVERQEPPASTPVPTASQSKRAKAKAAKRNKKSIPTVLERSSIHSRDGQSQSAVTNPMLAPSPMRRRAAGPSRLAAVETVDSSHGSHREQSPAKKQSTRPRRGSLLPTFTGQILPVEAYRKKSKEEIQWSMEYQDEEELDEDQEREAEYVRSQELTGFDGDEREGEEESADADERHRQLEAEREKERRRQEEEAEYQARAETRRLEREQEAEEKRLRDEAHAARMAQGLAQVKAIKAEAKAKAKAEKAKEKAEREDLRRQHEAEIERQRMAAEAEATALAEAAELQRRHEEEEAERLRVESEAQARAAAEAEELRRHQFEEDERSRLQAEAESRAIAEAEELQRQQEDEDERARLDAAELQRQQEAREEELRLEAEIDDEVEAEGREDYARDVEYALQASQKQGDDLDEQDISDPVYHGHVSEQYMQIKLPGPTTMSKLQQSGSSYSMSSPYSQAPYSTAPYSTASSAPPTAPTPAPSCTPDYLAQYFPDDSSDLVEPEQTEEHSQESAESWQGIPDTPGPSVPSTSVVPLKRSFEAVQHSNPGSGPASPFRPPMNSSVYSVPASPTNSQKRRRADMGWQAPASPVQGIPRASGPIPLHFPGLSPKSARIERNKAAARVKRDEHERKVKEEELDKHLKARWKNEKIWLEMEEKRDRVNKVRFSLLSGGRIACNRDTAGKYIFRDAPLGDDREQDDEMTEEELEQLALRDQKRAEKKQRDAECLDAFEQCLMDGNDTNAGFYLATALDVLDIEPRRICDIFANMAALCVPPLAHKFPVGPNPHSEYYVNMASTALNIVAFEDASNIRIKALLWNTTKAFSQAQKSMQAVNEYTALSEAAQIPELIGHPVPACLKKGTQENREHRAFMDRFHELNEEAVTEDHPLLGEAEERARACLPRVADEWLRGGEGQGAGDGRGEIGWEMEE